MTTLRNAILSAAEENYGTLPEYLWAKYPSYAVLRHPNKKWYAVAMNIPRCKLGLEGTDGIEVMNVKADPLLIGSLRMQPGIFPAYHMNKEQWISVLLDGTVPMEQLEILLDMSYHTVGIKKKPAKNMRT